MRLFGRHTEPVDWSTAVALCHRCGNRYPVLEGRSIAVPLQPLGVDEQGITLNSICRSCADEFRAWWGATSASAPSDANADPEHRALRPKSGDA